MSLFFIFQGKSNNSENQEKIKVQKQDFIRSVVSRKKSVRAPSPKVLPASKSRRGNLEEDERMASKFSPLKTRRQRNATRSSDKRTDESESDSTEPSRKARTDVFSRDPPRTGKKQALFSDPKEKHFSQVRSVKNARSVCTTSESEEELINVTDVKPSAPQSPKSPRTSKAVSQIGAGYGLHPSSEPRVLRFSPKKKHVSNLSKAKCPEVPKCYNHENCDDDSEVPIKKGSSDSSEDDDTSTADTLQLLSPKTLDYQSDGEPQRPDSSVRAYSKEDHHSGNSEQFRSRVGKLLTSKQHTKQCRTPSLSSKVSSEDDLSQEERFPSKNNMRTRGKQTRSYELSEKQVDKSTVQKKRAKRGNATRKNEMYEESESNCQVIEVVNSTHGKSNQHVQNTRSSARPGHSELAVQRILRKGKDSVSEGSTADKRKVSRPATTRVPNNKKASEKSGKQTPNDFDDIAWNNEEMSRLNQ